MTNQHHEIWLFRHGETRWSKKGRQAGRADLPPTRAGFRRAHAIGRRLSGRPVAPGLNSPLVRAFETCSLAGDGDVLELTDDLMEWDDSAAQRRLTVEIQEGRSAWSLWRDGAPGGETVEDLLARTRKVIGRAMSVHGDVARCAHGHVLRVLTSCWLGVLPAAGRLFALGKASVSVLDCEHDTPLINRWNENGHLIDVSQT